MSEVKWTMEDLANHMKANMVDSYGSAIVMGAFHKAVFGTYPKIGLSGHQASAIDLVCEKILELKEEKE